MPPAGRPVTRVLKIWSLSSTQPRSQHTGADWHTGAICAPNTEMPASPADSSSLELPSPSLAVATLWQPSHRFDCSLLLWCSSAVRVGALLSRTQHKPVVIVASGNRTTASGSRSGAISATHEDCDADYVLPNDETSGAVAEYIAANRDKIQRTEWVLRQTLLKLHVFALTHAELILFTDLDVDPYGDAGRPWVAAAKILQHWRPAAARFLQSRFAVVGTFDHEAPLNTGLLLVKPNRDLHADAMRRLRRQRPLADGVA